MDAQKRSSVFSSFLFKFLESCLTQGISFVVSVLLARRLAPDDYGVLALLLGFVTILQVFVQSGLNTALIQKKETDETDASSVFYASLGIALLMYLLLFFAAPLIADYFASAQLRPMLRVLGLMLFPGAYHSVQLAVITRELQFRKLMTGSLLASLVSGAVGLTMAYSGLGCWALVGQQLASQFSLCVILTFLVQWRPKRLFSLDRLKGLYAFGWKMLASTLIDTLYNNLRTFVIGKKYSTEDLGFYNRGKQFPELIMYSVNGSIQSVMLPVLSKQQDDPAQMKAMLRRSLTVSGYLVFPIMMGLALVAKPLIALLLTDKWLPCVPFLQVCCLDFALYPVHTANLQAISAKGRSDVFLRLEIIKKVYGVAILLVTVFCFDSAFAIAAGGAVSTLISAFVNAYPNKKLLGYGYREQLRDLIPPVVLSLLMGVCVYLLGLLPLGSLPLLLVQVLGGALAYIGLSALTRNETMRYLIELIKSFRVRKGETTSEL